MINKKNYRIIEIGKLFYPQWRGWFLWNYYYGGDFEYPSKVSYETVQEARDHIKESDEYYSNVKVHNPS